MTYRLASYELYWDIKHGRNNNSSQNIDGQYLVCDTFNLEEFYDNSFKECLKLQIQTQQQYWRQYCRTYVEYISKRDNLAPKDVKTEWNPHKALDYLRNSFPINRLYCNPNHNNIEIVEIHELPGQEQVAIKKTFWLKLLQRKFRKLVLNRNLK